MKAIKINAYKPKEKNTIYTREKRHKIILGNHKTILFDKKRDADIFISQTNYLLNITIIEVNQLYIDIWITFKNLRVKNYNAFTYMQQQDINEEFKSIDKNIDFILNNPQTTNSVVFVLKNYFSLLESINKLIKYIITTLKQKNNYYSVDYFRVLEIRTNRIKIVLDEWGNNKGETIANCYNRILNDN